MMKNNAIPCLICGSAACLSIEDHWTNDPSRPILRVCCPICRDYAVEGICDTHDNAVFDDAFLAYLNQLGQAESRFLSQSMRQYREGRNDPYLTRDFVEQLITDWHDARAILLQYDLDNAKLKISGPGADHRNPLFIVDTPQNRFTMRLHAPGTNYDEVASKVYWLSRLRDAGGVMTLKPVSTSDGSFVSGDAKARYAILYEWLDGKMFDDLNNDERTSEIHYEFGRTIARMHRVGAMMPIPQWFVRPRHSRNHFQHYVSEMRTDIDKFRYGILDDPQKDMPRLDAIERRMLTWMDSLGESPEHFGLIHGDLWIMNVLVHNGEIRLVDVMHCGWGYYLAELHKPMWARFTKEEAEAYLTGYQEIRPLPSGWHEGLALLDEVRLIARHWF